MREAPPVRLVVSDVDGTLVRHDKTLAPATVAAFARLAGAGIRATLISARPPSGMTALAATLGLDLPLGAFNGGTLFRPDGTILSAAPLEPALAHTTLTLAGEAEVDRWYYGGGRWYVDHADNPRIPREILSAGVEPVLADPARIAAPADKIVCVSEDAPRLARLERRLADVLAGKATVALSQPYFLDVTALAANKGDGVAALARAAGVPLEQVAVLGDMPNDVPMFERAGLAIAMGQAPEAVRAAAAFVTASSEEDGVARAIDRYLLPRGPVPQGRYSTQSSPISR